SRTGNRIHHRHDDDGSAVQEGTAGAAKSRPRVRLSRVRHAPRDGGRRRDGTRAEPLSPRRVGAAADPVFSRRRRVRSRSRAARRARAARSRKTPRPRTRPPPMTEGYLAHGITLALAWFFIVNVAASIGAAAAGSWWLSARERPSALWFLLRLSPAIVSAFFVVALFLPSYWRYEPPDTTEGFDLTLTGFALAAIALIGWAWVRGAAAWVGARRRARAWMRGARPFGVHSGVRALAVDGAIPLMALVGII